MSGAEHHVMPHVSTTLTCSRLDPSPAEKPGVLLKHVCDVGGIVHRETHANQHIDPRETARWTTVWLDRRPPSSNARRRGARQIEGVDWRVWSFGHGLFVNHDWREWNQESFQF